MLSWWSLSLSLYVLRLHDVHFGRFGVFMQRSNKSRLLLLVFCISESAVRVGSVSIFTAAYKGYVFVFLFIHFVLVALILFFSRPGGLVLEDVFPLLANCVVLLQPEMRTAERRNPKRNKMKARVPGVIHKLERAESPHSLLLTPTSCALTCGPQFESFNGNHEVEAKTVGPDTCTDVSNQENNLAVAVGKTNTFGDGWDKVRPPSARPLSHFPTSESLVHCKSDPQRSRFLFHIPSF